MYLDCDETPQPSHRKCQKIYIVNTKTASRYCHIAAYYPGFVCWKQQYTYFVLAEANRWLAVGSAAMQIR